MNFGSDFMFESRGGARNFRMEGADSSDKGAKIQFSRYFNCHKSLTKIVFQLLMGD